MDLYLLSISHCWDLHISLWQCLLLMPLISALLLSHCLLPLFTDHRATSRARASCSERCRCSASSAQPLHSPFSSTIIHFTLL
ncbi:hypothetical protein BGW80DRAFT_1386960 [Lactifluus volemus]|nr:hypothetical protein BGW80DRAFT_1386960 [Lactifluus volemus]